MKKYRVKVTEKHSDYVWIDANSEEEAKDLAPSEARCEFECLYDCEVVGCEEIENHPYNDPGKRQDAAGGLSA